MNYECEFRDFLLKNLKEKFQISDEINLLLYLHLRYECLKNTQTIQPKDFMRFIMNELYIVDENDGVVFENHYFSYSFAMENSIHNIFDEWNFRLFHSLTKDLNGNARNITADKTELSNRIKDTARRKMQKYKNSKYKNELLKYFKLMELNCIFNVSIADVPNLSEVHQLEIRLTDEECLERYLQAENFNSTNTKAITEAQLRDYLFVNLHLLENGLIPIEKEAFAGEGRIDILAKDTNDNIVIIELKTEIDKRLVWQCLYYPEILKRKSPNKIRVITVCPEYPEYLLVVLRNIHDLEMFQYQVHSTNCRIEDIQIEKIN